MKSENGFKGLITILFIALCSSRPGFADDRSVLHYDHPIAENLKRLDHSVPRSQINARFMCQALPLGNGRFGAMFSGNVDSEYLVFNDITLWMNSTRGESEFKQSGSPTDGKDYLELVRAACREGKYGTKEGSIESLGTKYLSSKQRLGNFAPFADLEIRTGHDPSAADDYHRALDISTGVGSVRYTLGDVKYSREYFCSHPQDLFVARFTAEGGKMDLVLEARTPHPKSTIESKGREILLRASAAMDQDDMEFMQAVRVVAGDAKVEAKANGTLHISGASKVILLVAGHTDYLPTYPEFKRRDFEGDTLLALREAEKLGYTALKSNHVSDVQSLIGRVHLNLGVAPSGLPTDRLVRAGDPREVQKLYFDYARYLQICSSRDAPVPSNLQGLWNTMLTPPWNSDYHNDINVQMNYWMVETANLPESFSPFVEWTKVLAESGRHTAWGTFGVKKGWTAGLNGNIFGFTAQNVHGRRVQQGGHWLAQHLFEHYAFNKDRAYLEEVYPILKGAAEFFVEHLAPWKDGTLVVYPTWSPENFFLKKDLRSIDSEADTFAAAAYVPYREDPKRPNKFVAVVPPDSLAEAPYILDLLPALPSAWPKGSVKGLRARGGFEVDMEWKDGQLVQATIRANRDGAFRIYAQDKLSKVISLKKGQSKVWPSGI